MNNPNFGWTTLLPIVEQLECLVNFIESIRRTEAQQLMTAKKLRIKTKLIIPYYLQIIGIPKIPTPINVFVNYIQRG